MEPQNTFIVRFWWRSPEECSPTSMGWYGRVQHLQSGEGMCFLDVHGLHAFIQRYVTSFEAKSENAQSSECDPSGPPALE